MTVKLSHDCETTIVKPIFFCHNAIVHIIFNKIFSLRFFFVPLFQSTAMSSHFVLFKVYTAASTKRWWWLIFMARISKILMQTLVFKPSSTLIPAWPGLDSLPRASYRHLKIEMLPSRPGWLSITMNYGIQVWRNISEAVVVKNWCRKYCLRLLSEGCWNCNCNNVEHCNILERWFQRKNEFCVVKIYNFPSV